MAGGLQAPEPGPNGRNRPENTGNRLKIIEKSPKIVENGDFSRFELVSATGDVV